MCMIQFFKLCNECTLRDVHLATLALSNTLTLHHVHFATLTLCNMCILQYVHFACYNMHKASKTNQLDGSAWSLGQFAYSKTDHSVCMLSQLPSSTKALLYHLSSAKFRPDAKKHTILIKKEFVKSPRVWTFWWHSSNRDAHSGVEKIFFGW